MVAENIVNYEMMPIYMMHRHILTHLCHGRQAQIKFLYIDIIRCTNHYLSLHVLPLAVNNVTSYFYCIIF